MRTNSTIMIHNQRSRIPAADEGKANGQRIAFVRQCDLKQSITIDLDNQIYSVHPLPKGLTHAEYEAAKVKAQSQPKPAETLTIITNVEDTGETKLLFGRIAYHYKIHTKREPSSGANAEAREEFTDGWFIDIPEYQQLRSCDPFAESGTRHAAVFINYSDSSPMNYRIVPKITGAKMQATYPADTFTTTHEWLKQPDGSVNEYTSTTKEKIATLSTDPLDPGLFDAPKDYARVSEVKTIPTPSWIYRAEIAWAKFWSGLDSESGNPIRINTEIGISLRTVISPKA